MGSSSSSYYYHSESTNNIWVFKKIFVLCFFFQIETEDSLKVLASIKKNVANPDDLDFMLKTVGVPLPQDVIQRALKNVAPRGEYLMYF